MEIGELKRVISISQMFFNNINEDLKNAKKNYYDDIEITREYLERVVDDLKELTKEIEKLL